MGVSESMTTGKIMNKVLNNDREIKHSGVLILCHVGALLDSEYGSNSIVRNVGKYLTTNTA
jgi:hypothetical protein